MENSISIEEGIEILTGVPAGQPNAYGDYEKDTVYREIAKSYGDGERIEAISHPNKHKSSSKHICLNFHV